ncbi:putative inorganic phosphate cotransporter [Octopus vulgaris]|uniref:Inorganic phosphate cotransporter n=1 Tax=Octopus vulgaris TaxID=6645 RepID=A0AA36F4D6_OCTVU|nr:putative inorganic phosphate cotransporter [Octopus vulgaris]
MVENLHSHSQPSNQSAEDIDAINPCPELDHDETSLLYPNTRTVPQTKCSKCFPPVRYNLMILGWMASLLAYCLRFDLSIALVLMVNQTSAHNTPEWNKSHTSYCSGRLNDTISTNTTLMSGSINWTPNQQGIITSAFFVGYFLSQVPWGIISQRIGGKLTVGWGLLACAILTFTFPSASKYSFPLATVIRGLMGLAQGSVFPGLILLQGKWVPVSERSKFNTVIGSGGLVGLILSTYITSLLNSNSWFGGWETPFYVFGGATFIWFIFWHFFMFNEPNEHPRISAEEVDYIQRSLMNTKIHNNDIPWKKVLTYIPLWSVNIMLFCSSWLFYSIASFLPTYMKNILGLDIHQNGIFSSLPYVAALFMSIISGILADVLLNKGVDITVVRKLFAACGLLLETLGMLVVVYLGCRRSFVEIMLIVAYGFGSFSDGGTSVTIIDIAPKYAGFIYGIANSVANLSGVMGPYVTGAIVKDESSLYEWKKAFWVSCGMNILGVTTFLCFGSAKKASWAEDANDVVINSEPSDVQKKKDYGTIVT